MLINNLCNSSFTQGCSLKNHIHPRSSTTLTPSSDAHMSATNSPPQTSTPKSPSNLFHLPDISRNLEATSPKNELQHFAQANQHSAPHTKHASITSAQSPTAPNMVFEPENYPRRLTRSDRQ
uniref:Uncharacterized protein n=1 Tax=Physcomitrium patens TaxID=3218 RepID=A0A2K1ISC1_PHYPA|nr:hypothetical protein PHYPA_026302 [Physcomitrium patens]